MTPVLNKGCSLIQSLTQTHDYVHLLLPKELKVHCCCVPSPVFCKKKKKKKCFNILKKSTIMICRCSIQ